MISIFLQQHISKFQCVSDLRSKVSKFQLHTNKTQYVTYYFFFLLKVQLAGEKVFFLF